MATKSLSIELTRFFHRINYNKEEKSFSKQSYSEARMKMKHEAYIELNNDLVREYYTYNDHKKYKEYRLIAIDGSRIQLPNKEEIVKEFGLAENKGKSIPMAMNSTAYDVLNNIVVNTYLDRYEASERLLAEKQLDRIKELTPNSRDIILMDRGYPSVYLFVKMLTLGYEFIVRSNTEGFLKEIKEFSKGKETDKIIDINLTKGAREKNVLIQKLVQDHSIENIKLRIVKIELESGKIEYLITSLLDKKDFSLNDLKEIYHLRWNEESYFNFQKNILEIENFSGRNPETIRQDYFARVLSSNLSSLLIEESQKEVDEQTTEKPQRNHQKYKINKSVAIGILKDEVIEMLFAPKDIWKHKYRLLVDKIKKFIIPQIPDRRFERKVRIVNKSFLKRRKVL